MWAKILLAAIISVLGLGTVYGMGYLIVIYDFWMGHPGWYAFPNAILSVMFWVGGWVLMAGGFAIFMVAVKGD